MGPWVNHRAMVLDSLGVYVEPDVMIRQPFSAHLCTRDCSSPVPGLRSMSPNLKDQLTLKVACLVCITFWDYHGIRQVAPSLWFLTVDSSFPVAGGTVIRWQGDGWSPQGRRRRFNASAGGPACHGSQLRHRNAAPAGRVAPFGGHCPKDPRNLMVCTYGHQNEDHMTPLGR